MLRTSVSLKIDKTQAKKIRLDDVDLISEHEIAKLAREADQLHRAGKLLRAKSMADLL